MREQSVLIGAGSAVFTRGFIGDLIRSRADVDLALVDTDQDALDVAARLAAKMIAAAKAPIRLKAALDRRDVLRGATVVICTIAVGGRRAREHDVLIPRRYGIWMPVADTFGPGGASRAMRMIPPMVAIARDVLDLAPDPLLFNYGNPMAAVCRAVHKATGANMVGLCHGVPQVARYLAGEVGIAPEALRYTAIGINHLTWFVRVADQSGDLMPRLQQIAAAKRVAAPDDNPFSWRLLQLFGAFPSALDRHVTEFFPQFFRTGDYHGRKLGVDAFPIDAVIARGDRIFAEMREDALSPQPLSPDYFNRLDGEHEQILEIIDAIRQDRHAVYSANLPNTGQAPNLPPEAIVEAPAVPQGGTLRAIMQPPLSPALAATLATPYMWVETIVDAALEGSREKFVQALVLDGCAPSIDVAENLADELLQAHARYLLWASQALPDHHVGVAYADADKN